MQRHRNSTIGIDDVSEEDMLGQNQANSCDTR